MGFLFDCKCFFGTITAVLKHDGVVEGGTGELKKEAEEKELAEEQAEQTELHTDTQTEIAETTEEN
jgi:hypothetical protein